MRNTSLRWVKRCYEEGRQQKHGTGASQFGVLLSTRTTIQLWSSWRLGFRGKAHQGSLAAWSRLITNASQYQVASSHAPSSPSFLTDQLFVNLVKLLSLSFQCSAEVWITAQTKSIRMPVEPLFLTTRPDCTSQMHGTAARRRGDTPVANRPPP